MSSKFGEAPSATRLKREVWWFVVAVAGLVAGAAGLVQPPRADPFQVVTPWTTSDWWRYPIEQNAFKRLPAISGSLNHVFALPDGKNVWAVGNGGLIVHSADGGKTWEQQRNIQLGTRESAGDAPATKTPVPNAAPKSEAEPMPERPAEKRRPDAQKKSLLFDLVPSAHAGEPPTTKEVANAPYQRQAPTPRNAARKGAANVPAQNQSPLQNQDYLPRPSGTAESIRDNTPTESADQTKILNKSADGPATGTNAVSEPTSAPPSSTTPTVVTTIDLKAINFSDAIHGWVVGHHGTILATDDGGKTWVAQISGTTAALRSVHFSDDSHGWAVGNQGAIVATADGGKNWTAQTSRTRAGLYSVHFSDARHGWAVGGDLLLDPGIILATVDGGKSWMKQVSGVLSDLGGVHFSDSSHGWAVGKEGTIVATVDGGNTWTEQTSGTRARLNSVHFSDPNHGWAVGGDFLVPGGFVVTSDGGKTWTKWVTGTHLGLSSVSFGDVNHGWAVGDRNTIFATDNGGKTWTAQTSGSWTWLNSVHFRDANHGWAVGNRGTVYASADGGANWTAQATGTRANLNSVYFSDARHGWSVGEGGTILATADGGANWKTRTSGTQVDLSGVHFSDLNNGWAVGAGAGAILVTANGGETWTAQASGTQRKLTSVHFSDGSRGWTVGDEGIILATENGGKTWTAQTSGTRALLNSVRFTDASHGWVVGNGTILATINGGKTWTEQTSGTQIRLNSVHFSDANHGWAAGESGAILATDNGGKTWTAQTSGTALPLSSIWTDVDGERLCAVGLSTIRNSSDGGKTWKSIDYRRYPAPWAWAAWLFSAGAGWRAWRRVHSAPPMEKERNIEDKGASDAPVEKGDQDRLNFEPVAKALGKFLQNQSTTAPLVLAVTGKWGTGKSSLMNLLRSELRGNFGVRSVWFNAWHHQNEENLLAALLENIRQQAVPPLSSPDGWLFRGQLACTRYKRRFVSSSLWLAVLMLAIGYVADAPHARWEQFLTWIKMFTTDIDKLGSVGALSGASGIAVIVVAVKVLLSLRAFGVNPAALMATTANQFKLRDASAQAGFRFQFQREFEEVTSALEQIDKRMLIFIDDLDRCQPDKVAQLLEAVNFLTSSGKCYIVLGMDRDYVVAAVGLSFEKIAQEIAEQKPPTDQADGKLQRQQFAQRYMKKLLNLEIPIPSLDPTLAEALFDEPTTAKSDTGAGVQKIYWRGQVGRWLGAQARWAPAAAVLFIIVLAWFGGSKLGHEQPLAEPSKKEDKANITPGMAIQWEIESKADGKMLIVPKVIGKSDVDEKPPIAEPAKTVVPAGPGSGQPPEKSSGPAVLEVGQTAKTLWILPLTLLGLLAGLLAYAMLRSLDAVVRDSEAFNQAVNIWKRLVIAKSANPREIKRFQNRVRYFAMRLRDDRERKVVSPKTQQTEAMLVALAALHHTEPALVGYALLLSTSNLPAALTCQNFPPLAEMGETEKERLSDLWGITRQCLDEHRDAGLQWPPSAEVIKRFKRWSDGIVT